MRGESGRPGICKEEYYDEEENVFKPCNIDEIASIVRIIEIREVSAHYE